MSKDKCICVQSVSRVEPKRNYAPPKIQDYGSLRDLTQTSSGTTDDGGGFFQFSGGSG